MTKAIRFTALVLAGDRGADDVEGLEFSGRKALLDLNGRPMVAYVLETLAKAQCVGDVFVIANNIMEIEHGLKKTSESIARVRFLEGEGSPVRSVMKTLKVLAPPYPVLVLTADSPLLSQEVLEQFCAKALSGGGDAAVAVIQKSDFDRKYPGLRRTFYPLKGDAYKGCNLFALMGAGAMPGIEFWLKVERDRKQALSLAAAFGWRMLFGVLFRRIGLDQAVAKASKIMGLTVTPVMVDDVHAAMDVDRKEQADMAAQILAQHSNDKKT